MPLFICLIYSKLADPTLEDRFGDASRAGCMDQRLQLARRALTAPSVVHALGSARQRRSRVWLRKATPAMRGDLFKYGDGSSHVAFLSGRHCFANTASERHGSCIVTQ